MPQDTTTIQPTGGIDPNVRVPAAVARAAQAAEDIHKQAYTPSQPDNPQVINRSEPDNTQVISGKEPVAPEGTPVTAAVTEGQQQQQQQQQRAPVPDSGQPGSWEHRYHSMEGRYKQSQVMIGTMQEQMSQMGDELVRLQVAFQGNQPSPTPQGQTGQRGQDTPRPAHVRLTDQDRQAYGPELLDLIKRAALDAVDPVIGETNQRVNRVQQRVQQTTALSLYQVLDRDVPNWREINMNPRFKSWCGLPDVYSGNVRGKLLNAAFQAADAPRVVAFFKGFLAEEVATGQLPDPNAQQQQAQPGAPVREAAVPLETLTSPGRAKPAPGNSAAGAADKPIYTREQIKWFYSQEGRRYYAGREQERKSDEQSIFVAQREGRVR